MAGSTLVDDALYSGQRLQPACDVPRDPRKGVRAFASTRPADDTAP